MIGVKRSSGFPDTINDMEQHPHGDTGSRHLAVATLDMAVGSGSDEGIAAFGNHSGKEKSGPNLSIAFL